MNVKCILIAMLVLPVSLLAQAPALDGFVAEYAKGHQFNGSVLVQAKGKVLYEGSFGLANIPFQVPHSRATKYRIASITKAFTSVLILQLVEQGRLDLGRTLGAYLPDYTGEAAGKVTLHQLLNHTSGLDNFDKVKSMEEALRTGLPPYQSPFTTDELIRKFCSGALVNVPGKVFDYNNADYILLGRIIEKVLGAPYEQVLKERILQPLKLVNTGFLHQKDIVPGLADTYFLREDLKALVNDLPAYPENWFAAGAMYSTPGDVMAFSNALFGLRLLKKQSLDLMITPGLDDYGYGVWAYDTKVGGRPYRVVKRPGAIMGAQAQLYHFLDPDVTVVTLSNTGTTDLDKFVAEIGRKVVGQPI